ncbi:unnamed protein product [Arctia plantaginis]|uniref:HTH CENPB-type domain-containing protein n=1 Tax=Arctia plantaginis TaxID=874455 RepID=A0A8S0ZTL1_ARCPL|nr:unnamed protein product [Arctia plantaginis]
MHYGLTIEQVRKLAYEFAKANYIKHPPSWDHNKMAGKDWMECYRKRNENLSLRKPENTSAARSYGFNKTAVKIAYFDAFTSKNITKAFKKTGIWPLNKLTFSDGDFDAVQVYHSQSFTHSRHSTIPEEIDITQEDQLSPRSETHSPSLLAQPLDLQSTSAQGLITPEIIRPYPKVARDVTKKSKKEIAEGSDVENETPVLTEFVKEKRFILVKFEKKKSVKHYVGQVITKYSPTEYKISFLRKNPGGWKFVFPNNTDEGTVYISDMVCILPEPKSASTARTANIFSFQKDLSMYDVQ